MQSFFNYFSFLNVTKIAELAGINASLMRQYTSGVTKAGQKQYDKIRVAVERISKELSRKPLLKIVYRCEAETV